MNPALVQLIMRMLQRQQRTNVLPGSTRIAQQFDTSGTPQAQQALRWLFQNQFNPGWVGNSNEPGGGNVFAGFTRGPNSDPNQNPHVGYAGGMAGGAPRITESPMAALTRLFGSGGMNDMGTFLSDIYAREGSQKLPDSSGSNWPFKGTAPRFAGGAGDVYNEMFNRGSSLANMDRMFSGEGVGGGGGSENPGWSMFLR